MYGSWDNSVYCSPFNTVSLDGLLQSNEREGKERSALDYSDQTPDPFDLLARRELEVAAEGFLDALTSREREIITRIFWMGETQTAVANRFGVSKMAISKVVKKITVRGQVMLAAYRNYTSH